MGIRQTGIDGKRILVVGGTGNIGRALCYVLARNNVVDVLARGSNPSVVEELSGFCRRIWQRDLSHDSPLDGIASDYDYVFHMAVHWGFSRELAFGEFDYFQRVNTLSGARLIYHFRDSDATFVFGSTGGVYQPCDPGQLRSEEHTAVGGDNPYEISKIQLEHMTLGLSDMYDVPVAVLRYFWPIFPWGGGGPARGVFSRVMGGEAVLRCDHPEGRRPMNLGYVADLVYATIAAAAGAEPARLEKDATGRIYNVSGHEAASLEEIAVEFARQMELQVQFSNAPAEGEHLPYVADVTKMSREIWTPRVGIEECIRRVVRGEKEGCRRMEDWMFDLG
jgi:nucleoside-diphosphate-sugar epimerase